MNEDPLRRTLGEMVDALTEVLPYISTDVRRLIELYEEKALFEPTTVRETLGRWSTERTVSDELRARLIAASARLPRPKDERFSWSASGSELFQWIEGRKAIIGAAHIADQIRPMLTTDTRFVFRAQMLEAIRQSASVTFERRVRVLADACRGSAEGWYKPILQVLLRLSRERGDTEVPSELGPLLSSCARNSVPSSILLDSIRVVRNSVAHGHTDLSLSDERVAFVSITRSGARNVVGPFTWQEFVAFADSCLIHFWTLTLVLRRHLRLAETPERAPKAG